MKGEDQQTHRAEPQAAWDAQSRHDYYVTSIPIDEFQGHRSIAPLPARIFGRSFSMRATRVFAVFAEDSAIT